MSGVVRRVLNLLMGGAQPAPAGGRPDAAALVRHGDADERRKVASRRDVRPDLLNHLASDPAPEVRCAVAANAATPAQTRRALAEDDNVEVRTVLARRIAHLAPGLSGDEQDRIRRLTYDTLVLLAEDQMARVRRILSEALKDVAQAPPDVVRRLAFDTEISVAAPVLEFSPVLTDDDFLRLIAASPSTGTLAAISRRNGVEESVSDAIAGSGDSEAIAVLLGNPSAQIREETLDGLIDRAPHVEAWHDPLVRRPRLSPRAVTRLAEFVADNLVEELSRREDLDVATARRVGEEVKRRLKAEKEAADNGGQQGGRRADSGPCAPASPYQRAQRMHRAGHLEESVLTSAVTARDVPFLTAALAVRAGISEPVVKRIVSARSAKGIVAVTWKAGLSMALATRLQTTLARVPPEEVLRPDKKGRFPLSRDEMRWQIDFFKSLEDGTEPAGRA